MKTRVTELFGIEQPVIQGAMAWVANASLAAGVSAAGGLGIVAAGAAPVEWVEEQIDIVRSKTDKPFGVNVMLMNPNSAEIAQLLADKRVPVITTGAGDPGKFMDMWKAAGCKVAPVVASATLAKRMERAGADAIIAEGMEAGGHIGQITSMVLIPAVRAAVDVPLIAAGGVADGRGMAAAMMLGAEGVQMGTRFLTIEECTIADAYKEKVLAAKDSDTLVTGQNSGHPVRQLKNRFARTAKHMEGDASVTAEELEQFMAGSLRKAVVDGDVVNGSMMSGISACLVHERGHAADVINEVVSEAEELLGLGADSLIELNARCGRVAAAHAE